MNFETTEITCPKCKHSHPIQDGLSVKALEGLKEALEKEKNKGIEKKILQVEKNSLLEGKELGRKESIEKYSELSNENERLKKTFVKLEMSQIDSEKKLKALQEEGKLRISTAVRKQQERSNTEYNKLREEHSVKENNLRETIEQLQKKVNQGSMQIQGEAGEIAIEKSLKKSFPKDSIVEIKKGEIGADCVLQVKNDRGQEVGNIIIESKRTKHFSNAWIPKIKKDMIAKNAEISILVTETMPKEIYGRQIEGVWVVEFHEYMILIRGLREALIGIYKQKNIETHRGKKSDKLYDYLTSKEFAQTVEQIISPYIELEKLIDLHLRSVTKLCNQQKQLINSSHMGMSKLWGDIAGITQETLPKIEIIDGGILPETNIK